MKPEHKKLFLIPIVIILLTLLFSKAEPGGKNTANNTSSNAGTNIEAVISMANNTNSISAYIQNSKKSSDDCSIYYTNSQYSLELTRPEKMGRTSCFPDGDIFSETSLTINYPDQNACDQEMSDATTYLKYNLKATSPTGSLASQNGTTQPIYWDVGNNRKFTWGNYNLNLDEQINNDGSCSVEYDLYLNT